MGSALYCNVKYFHPIRQTPFFRVVNLCHAHFFFPADLGICYNDTGEVLSAEENCAEIFVPFAKGIPEPKKRPDIIIDPKIA